MCGGAQTRARSRRNSHLYNGCTQQRAQNCRTLVDKAQRSKVKREIKCYGENLTALACAVNERGSAWTATRLRQRRGVHAHQTAQQCFTAMLRLEDRGNEQDVSENSAGKHQCSLRAQID